MKSLIAICFILTPTVCHSESFFDLPKTEYVYQAIHYIDMAQTLQTSDKSGDFRETNPFLGKNPSEEDVVGFFVATSIAHAAVTHYLVEHHPKYVKAWEYSSIIVGTGAVMWNFKILLD